MCAARARSTRLPSAGPAELASPTRTRPRNAIQSGGATIVEDLPRERSAVSEKLDPVGHATPAAKLLSPGCSGDQRSMTSTHLTNGSVVPLAPPRPGRAGGDHPLGRRAARRAGAGGVVAERAAPLPRGVPGGQLGSMSPTSRRRPDLARSGGRAPCRLPAETRSCCGSSTTSTISCTSLQVLDLLHELQDRRPAARVTAILADDYLAAQPTISSASGSLRASVVSEAQLAAAADGLGRRFARPSPGACRRSSIPAPGRRFDRALRRHLQQFPVGRQRPVAHRASDAGRPSAGGVSALRELFRAREPRMRRGDLHGRRRLVVAHPPAAHRRRSRCCESDGGRPDDWHHEDWWRDDGPAPTLRLTDDGRARARR